MELLVVPDNSLITSRPMFWDGQSRWADEFVLFYAGLRNRIAVVHCAMYFWARTAPETLRMRTGLFYPRIAESEDFDDDKARAACDLVVLEFTRRMNHARACGKQCDCADVSCDRKRWAKGPNWELLAVTLTVSRDLEDSHLSIDDHSEPIS